MLRSAPGAAEDISLRLSLCVRQVGDSERGRLETIMAGELMIAFTNPPTKTVPAHGIVPILVETAQAPIVAY